MGDKLIQGLSGAISAVAANLLLHPLELIRTKLQADKQAHSILQYVSELVKKEGLKGLYAGFTSSMVSVVTSYGTYFWAASYFRELLLRSKPTLSTSDSIAISVAASVAVTIVNTPIWTVNTRQMKGDTQGFFQCFSSIIATEGLSGLMKGFSTNIMLTLNPVIHFSLYDRLKTLLPAQPSTLHYFCLSAFTKFIATILTYPLLTIRTRLQLEKTQASSPMKVARDILAEEGFGAFYKGVHSKLLQTVLNSAILMACHERLTEALTRTAARLH
jgi:adenine nucleotide transporter 17